MGFWDVGVLGERAGYSVLEKISVNDRAWCAGKDESFDHPNCFCHKTPLLLQVNIMWYLSNLRNSFFDNVFYSLEKPPKNMFLRFWTCPLWKEISCSNLDATMLLWGLILHFGEKKWNSCSNCHSLGKYRIKRVRDGDSRSPNVVGKSEERIRGGQWEKSLICKRSYSLFFIMLNI